MSLFKIDESKQLATVQTAIVTRTQARLDAFARTRGYDSILSACTYVTDINPKFVGEGQYCVEARSATWGKLYEIFNEVAAGTRVAPASFEEIESELPVLSWPTE